MTDRIGAAGDSPPWKSAVGGVAASIPGTYANPWTDADRVIFSTLWRNPALSRAEVASMMGRSVNACENFAGRIGVQRKERSKVALAERPGPVPKMGGGDHVRAERQAEAIRAYWSARGKPVTVVVIYASGTSQYNGSWVARIVDTLVVPKPAPGGTR